MGLGKEQRRPVLHASSAKGGMRTALFAYKPDGLGKPSAISSRILQRRCALWSGATRLMRERGEVEFAAGAALAAQAIERALPLGVEVGVEDEGRVGIDHQPGIVLHLA